MRKTMCAWLLAICVFNSAALFADTDAPSHLKGLNHILSAHGYVGDLTTAGPIRVASKGTPAAGSFRITIWMNPDVDSTRIRDTKEIKFSTYRCSDSATPKDAFLAQTISEIQTIFPAVTGHSVPKQLLADMKTLALDQPQFYQVSGFHNVRLNDLPLTCGPLDGESTELDFFP